MTKKYPKETSRQTRYQQRKLIEGRCPQCGANAEDGFKLCAKCRRVARQRAREKSYTKVQHAGERKKMVGFLKLLGWKAQGDFFLSPGGRKYYVTEKGKVRCGRVYVTAVFYDLMGREEKEC